jgi:DNA polymerase alpha subunit A
MLKRSQGQIEDTTPIESQRHSAVTLVRPLEKYPRDFEIHASKAKQSRIQALSAERLLLNKFLGE